MSGIAQIIQAMMSVSPQVTQMGRPGGMPSISMGSPSSGAGGRFAANAARNRGRQPQAAIPAMPEIAPPVQGGAPVPPGGGPEGTPYRQEVIDAFQGQQMYDPQGQPGIQALERQYLEAAQDVQRYSNPQGVRDAWKAREELPQAQERLAQATSNINAYNQAQAQKAQDQRYMQARQVLSRSDLPPEQQDAIARQAAVDEKIFGEIVGASFDRAAVISERKFQQSEETKTEQERFDAYKSYGIPDDVAVQMARNEDMPVDTGVKLYWEGQEAEQEDIQAKFAAMQSRDNTLFAVDNTIKQITNTLDSARGFGALGLMGALTDMVPESPAYNTVSGLDTQRAALAFRELKDMREASKTGGALGNVSNREIELLYSAFARLDPGMGQQFISNLADVMQRYERIKWMLQNEESSLERMKAGELTQQEFFNEATEYTNAATARHMGTPLEALEDLKQNPETIDDFKTTFGWSPISNVRE